MVWASLSNDTETAVYNVELSSNVIVLYVGCWVCSSWPPIQYCAGKDHHRRTRIINTNCFPTSLYSVVIQRYVGRWQPAGQPCHSAGCSGHLFLLVKNLESGKHPISPLPRKQVQLHKSHETTKLTMYYSSNEEAAIQTVFKSGFFIGDVWTIGRK